MCSAHVYVRYGPIADNWHTLSQHPAFEFFAGGAEVAEMINGNSCRRECKLVKLFLQEFFEEVLRSDADCHVGVKIWLRCQLARNVPRSRSLVY